MSQSERQAEPDEGPRRTRGGWVPVGTAAQRRASHDLKREGGKESPTRSQLVAAAKRIFERQGYYGARVADIVAEAGVAHGSFYTYFSSKREIFVEVMAGVSMELTEAVSARAGSPSSDIVENLAESNHRYLDMYRRNSILMGLMEQVAMGDPDQHKNRLAGRRRHIQRVAATIRRWQDRGAADPDIDPETTAAALVSMLSNFAYWQFEGGDHYDELAAERTLNLIWTRAVGLRNPPASKALRRDTERQESS